MISRRQFHLWCLVFGCAASISCAGYVSEFSEHLTRDVCAAHDDGFLCDGTVLKRCANGSEISATACEGQCLAEPFVHCSADEVSSPEAAGFCDEKADGLYCNAATLVSCGSGKILGEQTCDAGCDSSGANGSAQCLEQQQQTQMPQCPAVPTGKSTAPPTAACNYMDWDLEVDGFYSVSRFGADTDPSTMGRTTTCGYLQQYYNGKNCLYDGRQKKCLAQEHKIPWVTGTVDYPRAEMFAEVDAHMDGDVPIGKYFYVAGAQRFGCGALLRMSNLENGRCVVVYAEDGGPGTTYEMAGNGGRRIVDSSPAVLRYLKANCCWSSAQRVLLEWAKSGDFPGKKCNPCESTPVMQGTEDRRSMYDADHMMGQSCR